MRHAPLLQTIPALVLRKLPSLMCCIYFVFSAGRMLQPMLYCERDAAGCIPLTLDPRVLYRGVGVSIGNMVVLTGLQFPLTGAVAKTITGGVDGLRQVREDRVGLCRRSHLGFVCAPMELVMIQQQRFGTSMLNAAARIVQEQGRSTLPRARTSCGRRPLRGGYLGMGPVFAEQLRATMAWAAPLTSRARWVRVLCSDAQSPSRYDQDLHARRH